MSNTAPQNKKNSSLIDDYKISLAAMETQHSSLDLKEKVLISQPTGKVQKEEARTRIADPTLLSSIIKQNNSTMAQMPSGKVIAMTKENRGKSLFMDAILKNHVIPNATSQYDAFTKLWLLSFYRKAYGSMPVLVDYIQGGGYGKNGAGPDFTILPIRSVIPQIGKYTENDCDYMYVRSRVSKSWLEKRAKDKNWKNVDKILEHEPDFSLDMNNSSYVERNTEGSAIKREEYEIVTRYEPDKWTVFHPKSQEIARESINPQKNDKIPVIMCHAYPLLDRFIGLGDFERGMDLHTSLGSLISLFLDGAKSGVFPNLKIDPQAIENWVDIKKHGLGAGQIWLMKPGMFDRLQQMDIKPDLAVFQSTYQFLKASVLTITNTSDTSVTNVTDPGFGKTPQALKMQAFTQGMQTQFDRRMLEIATEKIFDRMIDLVAKRQEKEMKLYLKEADLNAIKEVAPDVVEMFEVGKMGSVVIKHTDIKNVEYRYEIDQGSTVKKDEILENESLKEVTGFVLKNVPNAAQSLQGDGKVKLGTKSFDIGEAIKRITISSGVTDWDKIITENGGEASQDETVTEQIDQNSLNMEDQDVAQTVGNAIALGGQNSEGEFNDPLIKQAFTELQSLAGGGAR